ncbi:helicase-exonuclease AddAB subunit AddA [Clostridium sp. WILCCON 0269]|uniref:ATP-dependent helicase/nuclease subunit A n=1 Tax=Candidatus Clostridium eludens TaxID=3381663 RepID=A0ABW8SHL6_9CLOT
MNTKWTETQRKAIFTQNSNLLVAAGAGTGKTAVLVERILQKVTSSDSEVDIDKLLVVTFTNAAASEMKERIAEALSKLLELNCTSKNLQRQLALLNQSNIMTIHSFCLKVIKNNFHMIDLDPNFRICDSTESKLLKQDVVLELFEEKYEEEDLEFLDLVDGYGGKNDTKLQNTVLSLYEFSQGSPWPKKWLQEALEDFNVGDDFDFGYTKWASVLVRNINVELKGCKDKMENILKTIENVEGLTYYLEPFKNDIENINRLISTNSWNEMRDEFIKLSFDKLSSKRVDSSLKEYREKAKNTRDEVKKKLTSIREDILVCTNNIYENMKEVYPIMKCLISLVLNFYKKYHEKKMERNMVDFNDIEHFCLRILASVDEFGNIIPSEAALEYREYFEEIFIDEYQDSNEVQEAIMNMISRKDKYVNLFMVGDVKQSIYRFRQAKPELFLQKYNTYSEEEGSKNKKIKLSENFRSRKEVIDAINYIFKQIMCEEIGELNYGEEECLKSSADYVLCEENCGGDVELHIVDKKESEDKLERDEDEEELLDIIQVEARLVAEKINELVNPPSKCDGFKVYDKVIDSYRSVMYKDIVVLMRATQKWAPTFVEELNNSGIPVFADTSVGYFQTIEIKTIISLLEIIDNPQQDIPFVAVLRSPIGGFSPEDLIDLRVVNREISFYEVLKAVKENNSQLKYSLDHIDEKLKHKSEEFLKKLYVWRRKVIYMPIDEFIWHIYIQTGYYGFVGAMPGGIQRQANLRMLFEKAKQYKRISYKGLFNFVNFINKLKSSSTDMGNAKILGESENVVRIMSIHKSKGLEFPVIILAAAGKKFNFMDMNKSILFHKELGLGPDYVNAKRHISYPTIIKQVLKRKLKAETLSEEMRILYVAFTRAKEKLIITGMIDNIERTFQRWCEIASCEGDKLPEYSLINAKNFLDWIGPSVARHHCGGLIREVCNCENTSNWIMEDNSKWKVFLYSKDDFKNTFGENINEDIIDQIENLRLNYTEGIYESEVNRRLNWNYKYEQSSKIPAKFSVSELKTRFRLIDTENSVQFIEPIYLKKPLFMKESKALTAAEKGTIMHLVMQHMDISKVNSYMQIKEQINKLVFREFITEVEAKSVSIYKILKFFNSEIGMRMKKSNDIYREIPFYMEIKSTELYKQLPEHTYKDEKVLIQGIIDCYFEENDELILIDYKTDYVENMDEIREKYKIQIYYYGRALEKLTGKKVKNKYLYLFSKDCVLDLSGNTLE